MKRLLAITLPVLLVLAGCNTAETKDPLADWLVSAELDAQETPEQLYEAALNEDILVIYSTSSRMFDVAKSFEERYEGLAVRVEDIREEEMYNKLVENYETGNFECDVICSANGRGILTSEFLPKNIAVKYVPYDMEDKLLPGVNEDLLLLAGEATVLGYNEQYYPGPPITNWWELTEEKWRGMVYTTNPARSVTSLATFSMIIQNSGTMAESYEQFYKEPLVLPDGENAGREYVRRLMQNDIKIVNSSDEIAEAIGSPGMGSPNLGLVISSKTRLKTLGYEMVNSYDMEPFNGVYVPINIMMAGGSKNVNTAKLFIRWILGETDGQGEGYKPYLQSGAWTVRNDVRDDTGVRVEELNLLQLDRTYLYENYDAFLEFWESLLREK